MLVETQRGAVGLEERGGVDLWFVLAELDPAIVSSAGGQVGKRLVALAQVLGFELRLA